MKWCRGKDKGLGVRDKICVKAEGEEEGIIPHPRLGAALNGNATCGGLRNSQCGGHVAHAWPAGAPPVMLSCDQCIHLVVFLSYKQFLDPCPM